MHKKQGVDFLERFDASANAKKIESWMREGVEGVERVVSEVRLFHGWWWVVMLVDCIVEAPPLKTKFVSRML